MKVICIDARPNLGIICELKYAEVYTVIGTNPYDEGYILAEIKSPYGYLGSYKKSRFIPLSSISETELIAKRELQTT